MIICCSVGKLLNLSVVKKSVFEPSVILDISGEDAFGTVERFHDNCIKKKHGCLAFASKMIFEIHSLFQKIKSYKK